MEASPRRKMSRLVWLPAFVILLIGCATPTLYSWGHYEELVYESYASPGKVSPQMQVEKLEEDYQKARAENKRVPPGFHAHLGYMYFQLGKLDQAQQQLETERAEFPESAVFIRRLLDNLKKF
jgi:hypothetical protein